jgi:Cu2+-exporting ATPase
VAHAFHAAEQDLPPAQRTLRLDGPIVMHAGYGVAGRIDNLTWRVGAAEFAGAPPERHGENAVWLGDAAGWVARFELQDALRSGTRETVQKLQADGLDTRILSGDGSDAVAAAAARLGIATHAARQTPAMKLEALAGLRAQGRHTLMVGDGVNDAPVLAAADVSMTVKGGTELANSSADLILTRESLELVGTARDIAQRARHFIRQNLTWAVVYNASVMPLAVSGALKPWMAALGMSLSSLLVVANASRLVRERRAAPVCSAPPGAAAEREPGRA